MKLKFINLLLAAFLLIGSAQALTSCKDTDEDLYAQLRDENLSLQKNLQDQINVLNQQVSALQSLTDALDTQIKGLEASLSEYAKKSDLKDWLLKSEFNTTLDNYIAAVSAYKNLKEVLDALKATQDEVTNAHGDFNNIGDRFVNIEGRLTTLEQTLQNYSTLVSDVATLNNFMQTTTATLEQLGIDSAQYKIDIAALQSDVTVLNTFMNNWAPKLGLIEQNAADALAQANQNKADIDALTLTYQQLQQLVLNNQTANEAAIAAINTKIGEIEGKLQTILDDYMTSDAVDTAIADAISGLATKDAVEALADALRKEAQENLDAVEARLQAQINECIIRLNGLDTKVAEITSQIAEIQGDLADIKADIVKNTNAIEAVEKSLNSVLVRVFNLENRISNIIIQATENPVLGYLNTPFGIESTFLMNYMGESENNVNFPNFYYDGVEYDGELILTDADIAFLQSCGITGAESYTAGQTLFADNDGNLGKVYLTLNPANIDLTGKDFTVVNSQNKVMPIELKNLRPSTKELTFGYSRSKAEATSPNGFYEADATVAAGDVPAIRVVVDKELKAAAKKVLKERNAASLLALGNAVYNQFNGFLPALGIRAAWQESDGAETPKTIEQSVYSKYGLGAATFNPLSYKFLYGKSFRHDFALPDISALLDDYKFDFTGNDLNISFDPITIQGVTVNFQLTITPPTISDLGEIKIEIPNYPTTVDPATGSIISSWEALTPEQQADTQHWLMGAYDELRGTHYATRVISTELGPDSDVVTGINAALQPTFDQLANLGTDINGQLQSVIDSLVGQIQGQVNGMMTSLQNQVNTSLGQILENLQNQVNGKIDMIGNKIMNNALYSRLQAIINKFNGVLADPNHYLQPVLLYSLQGQSYGMFSQAKALPSQFTGNGNAVMLTPTTYTGEIVTPAFKKFVAVTNVYKSSDYSVNAQAGDAKCKALAEAANAQPYMNEVVSGERRTIPFSYEGGKGYTYEIVYQALDYSGVTSTSKYYVSIK